MNFQKSWNYVTIAFVCGFLVPGNLRGADQNWQREWDQVVQAAKKEGKVVVSGPTGAGARKAMTEGFRVKFPEIEVDFTGLQAREASMRVTEERRFGRKLRDVHVGGGSTSLTLKKAGAFAEFRRALILPEVRNDEYWHGGFDFGFLDNEDKFVFAFNGNLEVTAWVNRASISATELSSPKQLIDPKFKGKMVMDDPRSAGPGLNRLTSLLKAYGEDYVQKLLADQSIVFIRNYRQGAEWLVRGRYPVSIAVSPKHLEEFLNQGLGKELEMLMAPEVATLTAGSGYLSFMEGSPHPNAAKVYINWFLTKDSQQIWAQLTANNSRRKDVNPGDPPTFPKPELLKQYIKHSEEFEDVAKRARAMAVALIGEKKSN
jgi:iron(III) transport system substrate-binding protein